MTQLTIKNAADSVGITRQALYRLISAGKVSSTTAHDGSKTVDTAELLRHFGQLQTPVTVTSDRKRHQQGDTVTPETVTMQIERLRAQLQSKEVEIALLKQRVSDLQCDKQAFIAFVEGQQRLLAPPKKSWWGR